MAGVLGAPDDLLDRLGDGLDGDAIIEALELRDRLDARIAVAVGRYDRAGRWALDGATSMTVWLAHRARRSRPEARRLTRSATVTAALPVTTQAWAAGAIPTSTVEAIADAVGTRHVQAFAAAEAELVPILARCDARRVAVALRRWRHAADDADPAPVPAEPDETFHLHPGIDGRGLCQGDLAPHTTTDLTDALALADSGDLDRSPAQRRAEALGTIARFFCDHHHDRRPSRRRRRPRVVVVTDIDQFTRTLAADPHAVDACDADFHRLVVAGGSHVLDYGRATRAIPTPLREVIALRDQHCRWPGCDRPDTWCDTHHVTWWDHGGTTSPDNLVLLCRRHHRHLHHQPGWHAKLLPDATLELTHPDGRTETTHPPGPGP